jgi:hypothetical protein
MDSEEYKSFLVKSTLGILPGIGGPAAEFYSAFLDPVKKRQEDFLKKLHQDIIELKKGQDKLEIERLKNNQDFISALILSNEKSFKITDPLKIEYLKNITLNTALEYNHATYLNDDKNYNDIKMYFDFVEELNHLEICLLRNIRKSNVSKSDYGWSISISQLYEKAFPDKKFNDEYEDYMIEVFINNLYNNNLIKTDLRGPTIDRLNKEIKYTELGRIFLVMIDNPFDRTTN